MKINLTSVLVDDQQKALTFYTEKLGFVKKTDIPAGEFRWLTVVAPEQPDGPEQHQQRRPRRADDVVAKANRSERPRRVGVRGVGFAVRGREPSDLLFGLLMSDIGAGVPGRWQL